MQRSSAEDKDTAIIAEFEKQENLYRYHTKDYQFATLYKYYNEKLYIPKYQDFLYYGTIRASNFIEEVLLALPVLPFIVAKVEKDKLEVIIGAQRIKTLIDFYENKIPLLKLTQLTKLNGLFYKEIPAWIQEKLKNRDYRTICFEPMLFENRKNLFNRFNVDNMWWETLKQLNAKH